MSNTTARKLVVGVLGLVGLLGAALLLASLLPNATLTGRLLGAAGAETRAGSFTQDLVTNLALRLRLTAGLLLALTAALVALRASFADLVRVSLGDFTWFLPRPALLDVLAVGAPIVLAIGLRVAFVGQPMRYDEALTFNEFASRPLYYALSFYPDPNNHLLNTLLVHFSAAMFGSQPAALRLPAVVAGVLLVPGTYALARVLYGRRAAFLSAVLVAVSSYLVEYSTNARGYTLQALSFVALLGLVIVAVRRDSPTALLLAALVGALGAYAVPTMVYGVLVAAVWLGSQVAGGAKLVRIRVGHLLVSGLLLGLLVALLYVPVLLVSGADKVVSNRFVVPLGLSDLAAELPVSLARTWGFWNRDIPFVVSLLLVVGFVAAVVAEGQRRRVAIGLLAPLVCLAIVLVQRVAPFERVWLFLLPLYFAVVSGGVARLFDAGRLPALSMAVFTCLLGAVLGLATLNSGSILSSGETGTFPDAQAVTQTLQPVLASEDAVLTTLPASLPELQYYFPRSGLGIDTLVRPPADARRLFVVVLPGATPSVPGWRQAREVERYPGSVLLLFERSPD